MFATEQDIEVLKKLQEADRIRELSEKEFENLPHRKAILEVRQKLEEIYKKKTQVQDMLDDAEESFDKLVSEDAKLSEKQKDIEKTLSEAQGDYRSVESLSKELHGVEKRKKTLGKESEKVGEQIERISGVMKQIMAALQELEKKEQGLVAAFREKGGLLRTEIAKAQKTHEVLAQQLDSALLKKYEETSVRCGGIALSGLKGDQCAACRNTFDHGKMLQIKADAPVSTCPSCGRLLILE